MEDLTDNVRGNSTFKCSKCGKEFSKAYYLYKHCRRVHQIEPDIKKTVLCPVCHIKNRNYDELRQHISKSHAISMESQTLFFPSMLDFQSWKENMETATKCSYIIKKTTRLADESIKQYFWCNRSRSSYSKCNESQMKRAPRAKGSRKIESHCPSTMEVIQGKDSVHILFHKTHVGHDLELKHLPINKSEKVSLAMKIADGIPMDKCLDDIKSSPTRPLEKIHSLTEKDMRNTDNCYQLGYCKMCYYCKTCNHTYSCTCIDAQIKMNMCKHISAVHRCSGNQESQVEESEEIITSDIQQSDTFQSLVEDNKKIQADNLWNFKISQMNQLLKNNLNDDTKRKIVTHIDHIIRLASNQNNISQEKTNEPAIKKIEVQRRLHSTRKIRVLKPNSIKKPSISSKVAIKKSVKKE